MEETRQPGEHAPAQRAAVPSEEIPERYEEIVAQLGQVVERLEGGGLSLEEAIRAFERGVRLARAGAARLDAAERRVEVLLDGDRTAPFEAGRAAGTRAARAGQEDLP